MRYKLLAPPLYKKEIDQTTVQIICQEPYTVIERDLNGDLVGKSDDELIKLVLDQVAIEYDPTDKINRLDQALLKVDEKIKELDEAVAHSKEQSDMIQGAFLETMEMVAKLAEQVKPKEVSTDDKETTNETDGN